MSRVSHAASPLAERWDAVDAVAHRLRVAKPRSGSFQGSVGALGFPSSLLKGEGANLTINF